MDVVAEEAELFADQNGIRLCENSELFIERDVELLRRARATAAAGLPDQTFAPATGHDTVGAVALDAHGNIAAATSTGGTLNKTPGRVGDSSLIGCGCYADSERAAVSCTGWGEPIMKLVLGKWACDRVAGGNTPAEAAQAAMDYLKNRLNAHGGMILLDAHGRMGIMHNTPRMAWAAQTAQRHEAGISRRA